MILVTGGAGISFGATGSAPEPSLKPPSDFA
jgi:hypothetical protein